MSRLLRRYAFDPIGARGRQWAAGAPLTLPELRRGPRYQLEPIIRSLAGGTYLGDSTAVCRVLGRYKILVDTQDLGVGIHLMTEGLWEYWLTELILRTVEPGMCVVDIGANVGYFSLLMGELVGPGGQVHAFEPNPPIADRLRKSLAINGFEDRATVHRVALDEVAGETLLAVPENGPGGAHVIVDTRGRTGVPITLQRFDAVPALAEADFVKIDVEGHEDRVWAGMRGVLDRGRPMTAVLEFTPDRYRDAPGFLRTVADDGFSLALIDPETGVTATDAAALLAGDRTVERLILLRR